MEIETFKKASIIYEEIQVAERQESKIRKLYTRRNNLSNDDLEALFHTAIVNICKTKETLKQELKKL